MNLVFAMVFRIFIFQWYWPKTKNLKWSGWLVDLIDWLIDQCQFMNQWLVRQKIWLDLKSANLLKWRSRPGDWRWTTVRQMEGHRLVVLSAVDECSCSLFACSLHCPPWSYRWWPRGLCTCIQSRCCLAACVCSLLNASLSEIAVQGHSLEGAVYVLHCHLRDTALKRRNTVLLVGTSFQLFILKFVLLQTTSNRFRHTV